jgi:hypothetical protein
MQPSGISTSMSSIERFFGFGSVTTLSYEGMSFRVIVLNALDIENRINIVAPFTVQWEEVIMS